MSVYTYRCAVCDVGFDVKKSMFLAGRPEICPHCGSIGRRVYHPLPFSFGWRLTESSHEIGNDPNQWEKNI